MEKSSNFKIAKLFLAIVMGFMLLTWFIPNGTISTEFVSGDFVRLGLNEIYTLVTMTVSYFAMYGLYILYVGIFYGVLLKTGAYGELTSNIAKKFSDKKLNFVLITTVAIIAIAAFTNLSFELLALAPFVISVLSKMNFDKKTIGLVILGGIAVGKMGNLISFTYINEAYSLAYNFAILTKLFVLVVGSILLTRTIALTMKTDETYKDELYIKDKNSVTTKPLSIILVTLLVLLIASSIDLSVYFEKFTLYETVHTKLVEFSMSTVLVLAVLWIISVLVLIKDYIATGKVINKENEGKSILKVITCVVLFIITVIAAFTGSGSINIFTTVFGTLAQFGTWTFTEFGYVLLLTSVLIAFIYNISVSDYLTAAYNGAAKFIKPAIFATMSGMFVFIISQSDIATPIYNFVISNTSFYNVIGLFIAGFVAAFITGIVGYYISFGTAVFGKVASFGTTTLAVVAQMFSGLGILFIPTNYILLPMLSYVGISYKEWFKSYKYLFLQLSTLAFIAIILANHLYK